MEEYIKLVEREIEKLIDYEKHNNRINMYRSQRLHILFENCKHAKEFEHHQDHGANVRPRGGFAGS